MDNISDLPHLLEKASITPAPADPAGKGKKVTPEKNQPDLKLSSGSKLPSSMDEVKDNPIPTPEDLSGKAPSEFKLSSSSSNPTKTGEDLAAKDLPNVKISSSSNNLTKTGKKDEKDTAEDFADLLDADYDEDEAGGSSGFSFERLPGGGYRLERPTNDGGYFDRVSFEGPNEDGIYVLSFRNTRIGS